MAVGTGNMGTIYGAAIFNSIGSGDIDRMKQVADAAKKVTDDALGGQSFTAAELESWLLELSKALSARASDASSLSAEVIETLKKLRSS